MSTFKVGEIAIGQNFVLNTDLNGVECEILELPKFRNSVFDDGRKDERLTYRARWASGRVANVASFNLRKKHPPASTDETARLAMLDCIERARRGCEVSA